MIHDECVAEAYPVYTTNVYIFYKQDISKNLAATLTHLKVQYCTVIYDRRLLKWDEYGQYRRDREVVGVLVLSKMVL